MIIHQPEIIHKDGYAILWSKLELDTKPLHFPDHIWYRLPERYLPFLHTQTDAFLVAGLMAAMHFDEDVRVRGTVSPRLAYHLDEFQFVLNFRKPNAVRPVSIQYERLARLDVKPTAVGTTFSGGVDSLFTVWKHLPQNQPDPNYQVTHGIFLRGFDIMHTEEDHYWHLHDRYKKELSGTGIDLIEMQTNMLSIMHKHMDISYMNGPLILSTAIALQGLFQRFYMPSSWDHYNLKVVSHASDSLLDGFLSTDVLDIIHFGSTYRRVEKVEQIADWALAQNILWICFNLNSGKETWNCSHCEKCVRTMIPLYALGKLGKFKTFEKPFKKNSDGLRWARRFSLKHNFVTEMFPFVKKHKPDFLPWLYLGAALGYIRYLIVSSVPRFLRNWLKRYGFYAFRNESPNAFEVPEITQLIQSTSVDMFKKESHP